MTDNIDVDRIIVDDDVDALLRAAQYLGDRLASRKLSKSQFRNLFDSIKRIEMAGTDRFSRRKLVLLKPKMEHAYSRSGKKDAMGELKEILSKAIDAVGDDPKKFERFVEFFEAIMCYHGAGERTE